MIVSVTVPSGKTSVKYGLITLGVASDGTIEIPAYVGKTLVAAGCTCAIDLSTVDINAALADDAPFGANYMLLAYNVSFMPGVDPIALARSTFAANGAPAVTLS